MHRHVVTPLAAALAALLWLAPARAALAQVDLAGSWASRSHEDSQGSGLPVDYLGIPLTEEGRLRALSYSEAQLSMIERQCQGWPAFYSVQGPFGLRIWNDIEPVKGTVMSWTVGAWEDKPTMTIWMDGRPHPPAHALHTRSGFTTGRWEGDVLVAHTTHMKAGFLRKNGPPTSDLAIMTTRFIRHGDVLTLLVVIDDPIYLAEPWVLSKTYVLSETPVAATGPPCVSTYEGRSAGSSVPHFIPEQNPFVNELPERLGIPLEAVVGAPEAVYPEYRRRMNGAER